MNLQIFSDPVIKINQFSVDKSLSISINDYSNDYLLIIESDSNKNDESESDNNGLQG